MKNQILRFLRKVAHAILWPIIKKTTLSLSRQNQVLLSLKYKELIHTSNAPLSFSEVGFNEYSEMGEDGILLYIFSLIGTTNKKIVDIGAGGVQGSNSANLIIHHSFTGLLMDGDQKGIENAKEFYRLQQKETQVTLLTKFITTKNINEIISKHGISGEIDLLNLDIDGNDYWILKALEVVQPRVIVLEYQDILGPDLAWTIPYKENFSIKDYPVNKDINNYCGASLSAFVKLMHSRNYRLVGCNSNGFNAFFVKNGLAEKMLPEVSAKSCLQNEWNRYGIEKRFPLIKDMEWVEV